MNYVIIGGSTAAIGCIEGIRQIDSSNKIIVISNESYPCYGRPLISYWLQGKVSDANMSYRPDDFYEKNNCELLLNETVTTINTDKHLITLASGKKINFDKLLIATGSRPFCPPMEGLENVSPVFNFMTYDDAKAIKNALTPTSKVLIIGAGLIGLKAAEGIYQTSPNITIVDLADHILPSILDIHTSSIVKASLEDKGISFYLNDCVTHFKDHKAILKSGTNLDFDVLIIAVGVKPNIELAQSAGIEVDRGIMINPKSETSTSDIYAAGDCAQGFDLSTRQNRILALLPNAYRQGEAAGINMAGGQKTFNDAIPMNAMGLFGLHMLTAGSYEGEEIVTQTATSYKRLIFKDGYLVGFILIGDAIKRGGIYTSLIKNQVPINTLDIDLLKEKPQLLAFSKSYRQDVLSHHSNKGGLLYGNQC